MDSGSASWAYTKYAMLFFIALLVTWVSLIYTNSSNASNEDPRYHPLQTGYTLLRDLMISHSA